jgi:hypothetical protein
MLENSVSELQEIFAMGVYTDEEIGKRFNTTQQAINKRRRKLGYKRSDKLKNENICFNCKKACGECSWSLNFTPVEGWTATPSVVNDLGELKNTYHITSCPEFTSDLKRG